MASKKTKFNLQWLERSMNPDFVDWLCEVSDNDGQAYCNVCRKKFELSNMGRQAVVSHSKGPAHRKLLQSRLSQPSLASFVSRASSSKEAPQNVLTVTSEVSEELQERNCERKQNQDVSSFMFKDDVTKAEILWALEVVQKKHSLNSCADIGQLFTRMFSDSKIATQFQQGSTKTSYVINYGLAHYFRDQLSQCLKSVEDFVVCFDESLNKVVQRGQMDIIVRFWDEKKAIVETRYLTSVFLGRASAQDLLNKFNEGLAGLCMEKILHVSMDGPNVNISFLRKLEEQLLDNNTNGKQMIKFGTCGLHVVHGAVKTGLRLVGWDLMTFLRNLYYLFKDTPARRAEYTQITGSIVFPQKCCAIRWLENVPCLERALNIIDSVKKYLAQGNIKESKVVKALKQAFKDPLLPCKLAFFKSVSSQCEPFLTKFQSSKPLVPYMYEELSELLKGILKRFIKPDKLSGSTTQLLTLDLSSIDNLLDLKHVDVGFAARKLLKTVKVSEKESVGFRFDCQKLLKGVATKLIEKSPLKHNIVRGLSSLNPEVVATQPVVSQTRFNIVLEVLHGANRISESVAEKAKTQYGILCKAACQEVGSSIKGKFDGFVANKADDIPLDVFYASMLASDKKYTELWKVVKLCLVLSHGNASVESGFSINKSLLVENLTEQSLVNQRIVYDGLNALGGVQMVNIDSQMLLCVRSSWRRYKEDLERKRKLDTEELSQCQQKRKVEKELKELEEKRKKLRLEKQQEERQIEHTIALLEEKKKQLS